MTQPLSRTRDFLIGCVAIGLAIAGQQLLQQQKYLDATALYALGIILALLSFRVRFRATDRVSEQSDELNKPAPPVAFSLPGLLLMLGALACSGWMVWRVDVNTPIPFDWLLHLFSIGLFVNGVYLFDRTYSQQSTVNSQQSTVNSQQPTINNQQTTDNDSPLAPRYSPLPWLILLVGLAGFLRFFRFDSIPFGVWYDEAEYAMQARRILTEANFYPIFSGAINGPAHYLYLVAGMFKLVGVSVEAVRAVNAVMGMITVWAAYWLGAELFSRRAGLIFAFLMAVSGWFIILSRFGMHSTSTTPLFAVLSMLFLVRALRRHTYLDYAWAGLFLGLGLCFYTSFRLFILVPVLYILHVVIDAWWRKTWDKQLWLRTLLGLTFTGLMGLIVIAPLLLFAYRQPDIFWSRIQDTFIFSHVSQEERIPALLENTRKHLLMFNLKGDPNGRHNLPGEPMLDRISAALLILGVGLALWRIRQPRYLLLLAWLFVPLLAGILSLDFEAPQSLRSNGTLPAAYLLAALPLWELWRSWDRGARWYSHLFVWPLVALFAYLTWINYDFYFNRWANNFSSWNEYSTPQTIAAELLKKLDDKTEPYVISYFEGHPSIRFLTDNRSYRRIATSDHLPLNWPLDKEVELLLNAESQSLYEEARHLYPTATFEEIKPPFDGPTIVYRVHLTQADISQIQGIQATYFPNNQWAEPEKAFQRKEGFLSTQWPQQAPMPLPFSVEWQGVLRVESYGNYLLSLNAPAQAELWIDEHSLLTGTGDIRTAVTLAKGNHALRLRAVGETGGLSLSWQPPGQSALGLLPANAFYVEPVRSQGLLGNYYPNLDWQAPEAIAVIEPQLNMYYHDLPLPLPFSIEWSGKLAIPVAGEYHFGLESIDESTLWIDEQPIVSATVANEYSDGVVTLTAGLHDIRVRLAAKIGHTHINLYWQPPGYERRHVPTEVLFPPLGNYDSVQLPQLAELYAAPPTAPQIETIDAAEQPISPLSPAEVIVLNATQQNVQAKFNRPYGVAVGSDGRVYVADMGNARLLVFTPDGTLQTEIKQGGSPGSTEALQEPFDVVVGTLGRGDAGEGGERVYLLDAKLGKVFVYTPNGEALETLPVEFSRIERSRGIGIDGQGRLWFAHTAGGNLLAVKADGQILFDIPVGNDPRGQPVDVAVGGDIIYAIDGGSHKLMLFTPQGQLLSAVSIPVANTVDGSHLAVGADGFVYMTAPEPRFVSKFDPSGREFGRYSLPEYGIQKPVGIAVGPDGRIWIADSVGNQVVALKPQ